MSLTITEALSEINLIKKKIEKKQSVVTSNLVRAKNQKDPLENQGGSKDYIKNEIQSINDLMTRLLKLKGAIAEANITNKIAVNGRTLSIYDWLNWKRDLSASDLKFNSSIPVSVKQHLDNAANRPQIWKDDDGKTHLVEYELNVDYGDFLKKTEQITETLEKLDGQLSLKNATIVLEV